MMKREMTKREIHNTIAHQPDAQPVPEKWIASPGQLPSVYILDIIFCDVEHPFGQFGSVALAGFQLSFAPAHCLSKGSWKVPDIGQALLSNN